MKRGGRSGGGGGGTPRAFDLCACLDTLAPARPGRALAGFARAGIREVEFWDWRGRDLEALRRGLVRWGLRAVAFTGVPFDLPLVDGTVHAVALRHFARSLALARRLGVRVLVGHVGYARPGRARRVQQQAAVAGLRAVADLAAPAGVVVAVEPLNTRVDHPGYFVGTLDAAEDLLAAVDRPQVRLLLDVYHLWVAHGRRVLPRLSDAAQLAAHVHVADAPGRGEPGSGRIPWAEVVAALRAGGYSGPLGLECWPTGSLVAALRRARQVLEPRDGRAMGAWR